MVSQTEPGGFLEFSRRIIRLFSTSEVKTPLSFMFRALLGFVVILGIVLYAPVPPELKWAIIKFSSVILLVLCTIVGLFAWFNPKNLVYGEAGHRAEHRLEYGTEKRTLTEAELKTLRPVHDKTALTE